MSQNNTLQHTATHCNTLQHTATHCNTLQHTATHCNTLDCNTLPFCSAVYMSQNNTLQHAPTHPTHCNILQHTESLLFRRIYVTEQHTATHCHTLQLTAAHCNTLDCNTLLFCSAVSMSHVHVRDRSAIACV